MQNNECKCICPKGYFEEKASEALGALGIILPGYHTSLECKLMNQLLLLTAAAERVLSDIDDDGIAEAMDVSVLSLREALLGHRGPKFLVANSQ